MEVSVWTDPPRAEREANDCWDLHFEARSDGGTFRFTVFRADEIGMAAWADLATGRAGLDFTRISDIVETIEVVEGNVCFLIEAINQRNDIRSEYQIPLRLLAEPLMAVL